METVHTTGSIDGSYAIETAPVTPDLNAESTLQHDPSTQRRIGWSTRLKTAISRAIVYSELADVVADTHIPNVDQLQGAKSEKLQRAIDAIRRVNQRDRTLRRRLWSILCVLFSLSVFSSWLLTNFANTLAEQGSSDFWMRISTVSLLATFAAPLMILYESGKRKTARRLALQCDDLIMLPTLIDLARHAMKPRDRRVIRRRISDLLTRVKTNDDQLIPARHYRWILFCLSSQNRATLQDESYTELCLAIVQCLERIGDRPAIPVVRRLALLDPKSDNERRLHAAATVCLASLQTRFASEDAKDSLLRAAFAKTDGSLVRPAFGLSEHNDNHLLRACDPQ